MNTATRIDLSMTIRSLGRRWWTRVGGGYSSIDKFHWTERSARARHLQSGGQLLRRYGTRWDLDWEYEKTPEVVARRAVWDREFRVFVDGLYGDASPVSEPDESNP